jgi:hypothetical protein
MDKKGSHGCNRAVNPSFTGSKDEAILAKRPAPRNCWGGFFDIIYSYSRQMKKVKLPLIST